MRLVAAKKERHEGDQMRAKLAKVQGMITQFTHKTDHARMAMQQVLDPILDGLEGKGEKTVVEMRHDHALDKVRRDISRVGETVSAEKRVGLTSSTKAAFAHSVERPMPKHIDPKQLERYNTQKQVIAQKYGLAALAEKPMYDLPWRR